MKYLGTHHDTGIQLPSVGNAIWLSFYLGQYKGDFEDFMNDFPGDAGWIQDEIYIDDRSYYQQLKDAKDVDMIVLCVRCLEDEIDHFTDNYIIFIDDILTYLVREGYKNIKIELLNEPIELVTAGEYVDLIKRCRFEFDKVFKDYNIQLLAGAGDLHTRNHKNYYKYLRDNAFHDFDCWSIHAINDPLMEMIWAVKNLGDKPIHITEFTTLDQLLAWGASDPKTLWFLNECITFAQKQSKIKSLLQVFPAKIEGKYKHWSIHKSAYLTKLREFYNKYIKEEIVNDLDIKIPYGEKSLSVRYLQYLLEWNAFSPKYFDGKFGDLTLKALNDFQKDNEIEVKNYCDTECLKKMVFEDKFVLACLIGIIYSKTK